MIRVHIFVEGQTEETFVREVLQIPMNGRGIFLNAILVRTSTHGKGGIVRYSKLKPQIIRKCLEDRASFVTTMFDLYGLPGDFPSVHQNTDSPIIRAMSIEAELLSNVNQPNFIPNLLVHEFEALLYSDPNAFSKWFPNDVAKTMIAEKGHFDSPEHINDSPRTAPSKRILKHRPDYEKPLHGSLIALDIGLDVMRHECKHFDRWISKIESLAN